MNQCRIAFHGHALHLFGNKNYKEPFVSSKEVGNEFHLSQLRVFKEKSREGQIERKHDESTVICKNLFKKETNMDLFIGLKVSLSTGEIGVIEGTFGQSGKVKIRVPGLFYFLDN